MRRASSLVIAALAAGLLAGCAHVDRPKLTPLAEIPVEWVSEREAVSDPFPADWAGLIGDEFLEPLIDEALENNLDLRIAEARLDQARARAAIAGADLYPQVGAGFDGGRRKQVFVGLPIPGAEGTVLSNTSSTFGVSFNVSWEADLWGRVHAGRDAASADLGASDADYAGARLSVAGQTAKAWFSVLEAKQQRELAKATLENRRSTAARVERRYERGLVSPLDVRLARADEASVDALVAVRERVYWQAVRQLEIILGRYPSAAIDSEALLPDSPPAIPAGVPSEILLRRPDLIAAEARLQASLNRSIQSRAALYPRIGLTGSAGTASNELEDLVDGNFSVWSLAANLLQPLFQGGRIRAGVDLSDAAVEEVSAVFARSVLVAFAEVEGALTAERTIAWQEEALTNAAVNARAALETAEQRYSEGLADYLTVLESQRATLSTESGLLDVRRQRLAARIDLYLALGGDFESSEEEDL